MNTQKQIDDFLKLIGYENDERMCECTSVKEGHLLLEDQSIEIEDDQKLVALPKDLEVQFYYGDIPAVHINKCHYFKKLEHIFTDSNGIFIEHCESFEEIGEHVSVGHRLELQNVSKLHTISPDLVLRGYGVGSGIGIKNAPLLRTIPEFLYVNGGFRFEYCPLLEEIPENFANRKVYGYFELLHCTTIKKLPSVLWVQENCTIENCPLITKLPDSLVVGKNLCLKDMNALTTLPENLIVKGDALFMGCKFSSFPEQVHIGGNICIYGDISKETFVWIQRWKKQGMVKGEIKLY